VRTQTLVKNCIVQIDAAPFRQWYQQHYGVELGQKKGAAAVEEKAEGESKVGLVMYNYCMLLIVLLVLFVSYGELGQKKGAAAWRRMQRREEGVECVISLI
jgi:hypothetical protein